tara:strand:+ start:50 stop:1087 length:1038 start_codon:yes stop_codon:yes gene_type:complete
MERIGEDIRASTSDGSTTNDDPSSDESDENEGFLTLASRRGEDGRCRSDEEDEEADAARALAAARFARGATVSSRALDARALRRVARALEAKMRERDARWEACDAREREVAAAQARARADVRRFEAFVRENEVKRHVAMRREKEEREANARRDERLVEMRETLRERSEAASRVERELVRVRAFETFLTRVAEETRGGDAFEDISDVIARHETLRTTCDGLRASVASCKKRAEESREAHEREMKRVEEARLTSTAAAARLRQREEAARRENARLRQETAYKTRSTVERTRKLAEAKMAVRNLAARCARTDGVAPRGERLARELDVVEERTRVLREIAATSMTMLAS